MTEKRNYLIPEAEAISLRTEGALLTASEPGGASTEGFTLSDTFTDSDWGIN